jgi:hypothetical protein
LCPRPKSDISNAEPPKFNYHRIISWLIINKELRRIFGPKRDEITGGWRKPHTGEYHNFCFPLNTSDDQIKDNEAEETCSTHGTTEKCM